MPKPFYELRERLLRAGVAPRHVRRYLNELSDHLAALYRKKNALAAAALTRNPHLSLASAVWMISQRQ